MLTHLGFSSSLFVGRTRPRVNNRGVSGFVNLETELWPGEGERCLGWAPADEDRNLALLNLIFGKKNTTILKIENKNCNLYFFLNVKVLIF